MHAVYATFQFSPGPQDHAWQFPRVSPEAPVPASHTEDGADVPAAPPATPPLPGTLRRETRTQPQLRLQDGVRATTGARTAQVKMMMMVIDDDDDDVDNGGGGGGCGG